MAEPFQVGLISHGAAYALAGAVFLYAAGTAYYTARAFSAGLQDRWSSFVATAVMLSLSIMLWRVGPEVIPAPFSLWVLVVWAGAIAFTLTYTAARIHDKIEKFQEQFGQRMNRLLEDRLPEERLATLQDLRVRWAADSEGRRKTPHLLMGLLVLFYGVIGFLVIRGIWVGWYGGTAEGGGEGAFNLFAAAHADPGLYLVPGHIFGLMAALMLLFVLAPTELLRLAYPETGYPFKAVILNNLRDKEAGLFGAHYYITASVALAGVWLAGDPALWNTGIPAVMAVISVTVFADSASALFGIRFGRRKWPHNAGKSYVGTFAGAIIAFGVALPFVGWWAGAASALAFVIVDVAGPVPVNVSDNLLNPIVLGLTYTLMDTAPLIPFY